MTSILFVEDEASLRELIGDALAGGGYAVTLAADGAEAIGLLAANHYDCVVSDISMPGGVSGVELAAESARIQPDARVILVSGHARGQLPPLPSGTVFLPKPYRIAQLLSLVENA